MADRRPFSRPIEAEREAGLAKIVLQPEDHVISKAKDGLLDRAEPLRVRYLGLDSRQQALVLIAAGAIVTAVLWGIGLFVPDVQRGLTEFGYGRVARGALALAGPAMLAYGVLRLTIPEVEAPPEGARFGGVLIEARNAGRWKMQLAAIIAGLVHLVVFRELM